MSSCSVKYCGTIATCDTLTACPTKWNADPNQLRYTSITVIATIFICWLFQELLERRCDMAPQIRTRTEMHHNAKTSNNPLKTYTLNKRLTKSLDYSGRFRIQRRGSIHYIKAVWSLSILLVTIIFAMFAPEWPSDHFVKLEASTVDHPPYQHIAASIMGFYCWEVSTNRYGRLDYSVLMHHWLTAAAGLSILLGFYSPFSTWYGFANIAMSFVVDFTLGIRATFANKIGQTTRRLFTFTFYYYVFIMCLVFGGEIFIIINGFVTAKIHIASEIIMILTCCCWAYDDLQLLRALHAFSQLPYEDAEIFNKKITSREMGGRELFVLGVLHDIEVLRQVSPSIEEENGAQHTVLKQVTLHALNESNFKQENKNESMTPATLDKQKTLDSAEKKEIRAAAAAGFVASVDSQRVNVSVGNEMIPIRNDTDVDVAGNAAHKD